MKPRSKAIYLVQRKDGKDWVFCPDIEPIYNEASAHVKWDTLRGDACKWRIVLVHGCRAELYLG